MSPVGTIFVPFPPKTGSNGLHPRPPQSLNGSHHNPVWTRRKISAYSVSVALRASIALGSPLEASSVPEAQEKIHINSRSDIKVRGVASGESSVALES